MKENWSWEIKPASKIPEIKLAELWQYKDLLMRFVRRDHIVSYRQTILGPLWVFLEPLIATYVYFYVFSGILKVSTGEVPPQLFFLSGIILWTYFSDVVTSISYSFYQNASIFAKVYFPRILVPLSINVSKLTRLGIQLLMLVGMYIFFNVKGQGIKPSWYLVFAPVLIMFTALLSLAVGLIIAALSARYRDLQNLMMFIIRLLMFATPIFYPFAQVDEKFKLLIGLNPLTPLLEAWRVMLFSSGSVNSLHLLYGIVSTLVLLAIGVVAFGRVEQNVIDTI